MSVHNQEKKFIARIHAKLSSANFHMGTCIVDLCKLCTFFLTDEIERENAVTPLQCHTGERMTANKSNRCVIARDESRKPGVYI